MLILIDTFGSNADYARRLAIRSSLSRLFYTSNRHFSVSLIINLVFSMSQALFFAFSC